MKKLIIIGSGNVGGFLSYNMNDFGDYEVLGFLDDDEKKHGREFYGRRVLGHISTIERFFPGRGKELCVAIGISSPTVKATIAQGLAQFEEICFPNFIGRNVWISKNVQLGSGIILYPGVSINYETVLGDFVIMNMNCAIGHNTTISNYSTLAPGVNLAGYTFVEEGVDLGIGASTKQNVRIGKFSRIGGQSMLVRDVVAGSIVRGVPGRPI